MTIEHLPWSNRREIECEVPASAYYKKSLLITEKIDGEEVKLKHNDIDFKNSICRDHKSREAIYNLYSKIKEDIPEPITIFGEYIYRKNSINYDFRFPSFFLVHTMTFKVEVVLSWNETTKLCEELGLMTVPEIGYTKYDNIHDLYLNFATNRVCEGYVARNPNQFAADEWRNNIMKWKSVGFVNTKNWTDDWTATLSRTDWRTG